MTAIVIKQGDTRPIVTDTLTYSDGSTVDLTGASVNFVLRVVRSTTTAIVNAAATVTHLTAPATVSFTLSAVQTATAGRYHFVWQVTFADASTMEFPTQGYNSLVIEENLTSNSQTYCTIDELRDTIGLTDGNDDPKLAVAIAAASLQIDRYCGRTFWQGVLEARTYRPETPMVCEVDDISTTTGLIVQVDMAGYGVYNQTLVLNIDFVLGPLNSFTGRPPRPATELDIVLGSSWYFPAPRARPSVQVTAQFGWQAIPDDVNQATLLQAAQLYKAKDAPFGIAGFSDFGPMRVRSGINPIAKSLLVDWQKDPVG